MMVSLFLIMVVLVVRAVTLPNALEGLSFYLKPDLSKMKEVGIGTTVFAAMGQSFFTLSIGIGALAIFNQCNIVRHICGDYVRINYFSGVFCFWHQSGRRTGACFRNIAKCI